MTESHFRKITLTLRKSEHELIRREAERLQIPMSFWLRALVRRKLAGQPQFSRAGEAALRGAYTELRRIRLEIKRLRPGQEAGHSVADPEQLETLSAEVGAALAKIRAGVNGALDYWSCDET